MAAAANKKADDRLLIQYDKTGFGPHIRIFEERLKVQYPHVALKTEQYPLSAKNQALVTFIFVLQLTMTAVFMFGRMALDHFEIDIGEENLKYFEQNKFMVVPAMLMLSPVRQIISKTGAFEIYLNDELLSSTLTSRTLPNYDTLKQLLEKKGVKPTK